MHFPVSLSEETITVTDPGHPLLGRQFSLVEIYYRQDGVAFCRVKVGQWGQSDVPLTATDRGIRTPVPNSLLSHQSFQQLLTTYQGIMEARDDTSTSRGQEKSGQADGAKAGVVVVDRPTTTAICADNRGGLPAAGQSVDGRKGGT